MANQRWVAPALIFFGGAILGRVFGIRPLIRGAATLTALANSGLGQLGSDAVREHASSERSERPTRRAAHKAPRRRVTRKSSPESTTAH